MGLPLRKLERNYTYADYRNWPVEEKWELINGIAWDMSPAPSGRHQYISMELGSEIRDYLKGTPCRIYAAPFDVFFPASSEETEEKINTVVQPDLSVICDPEKLKDKGCFGPPDIIVEILSPYTLKKDMNEKFQLYESSGVKEYWVIDPGSHSVQLYRRGPNGLYNEGDILEKTGTITSKVLEGFNLEIQPLFESC